MTIWQNPKTDWSPGPNGVSVDDFNRIEGNTKHLYDLKNRVIPLLLNSRSNAASVEEYPLGFSVMRVNDENPLLGFPEIYGNIETTKTTDVTATQRFVGSGSKTSFYIRQTFNGVWQSWIKMAAEAQVITNANGTAIRFPEGTQICSHEVTLILNDGDAAALRSTWAYPASFASGHKIGLSAVLADGSSAFTPAKTMISYVGADSNGTTSSITLAMYRIAGMTNFAPGDSARVKCISVGRWF